MLEPNSTVRLLRRRNTARNKLEGKLTATLFVSTDMSELPHPPASNKDLAIYYWQNHFEASSTLAPAPFIHQVMSDYGNKDVVGQWIRDMSPLYRLYSACIAYGLKNGSPNKSLEARNYPGVVSNHVYR